MKQAAQKQLVSFIIDLERTFLYRAKVCLLNSLASHTSTFICCLYRYFLITTNSVLDQNQLLLQMPLSRPCYHSIQL
ncbi:MAG: hypothetical protein JWR18_2841 [Segetibacter sp.]|nr:hypothetical protein [Segetibacter sp.]